jgi:hypothetical protein
MADPRGVSSRTPFFMSAAFAPRTGALNPDAAALFDIRPCIMQKHLVS